MMTAVTLLRRRRGSRPNRSMNSKSRSSTRWSERACWLPSTSAAGGPATSSHQKIWDSTRRPLGRRLADEGVKYDRGACDEKRSLGERDVRRRGQFGHGPAATYRYNAAVNTASPARAAPAPEPIRRARDAAGTEETKEASRHAQALGKRLRPDVLPSPASEAAEIRPRMGAS